MRHVDAIDSTRCMGCGLTHIDWRLLTGKEFVVVQQTHVGCETQIGPLSLNLAVKVMHKDIDGATTASCLPAHLLPSLIYGGHAARVRIEISLGAIDEQNIPAFVPKVCWSIDCQGGCIEKGKGKLSPVLHGLRMVLHQVNLEASVNASPILIVLQEHGSAVIRMVCPETGVAPCAKDEHLRSVVMLR